MIKIKKFIQDLWNINIRYLYSKILFFYDCKDFEIVETISCVNDIRNIAKVIYNKFVYKHDFIDEIHQPPQCYKNYLYNKLVDDCDGFHAVLFHILSKNNITCYFITYIPKNMNGHTFIIFKYYNKYGYIDYNSVQYGQQQINETINKIKQYKYNSDYLAHYIWKWDYEKKKYVNCKESEL